MVRFFFSSLLNNRFVFFHKILILQTIQKTQSLGPVMTLFHSFIQLSMSHYDTTDTLPVIGEIRANKKAVLPLRKSEYRAGNYVTFVGCDIYALIHLLHPHRI